MASLLITKRGGVEANSYQVQVCFERRRYKLPGWKADATGERLSEELGRNIEKLLACKASGEIRPDLRRYVETLPARIRRSLAKQGIIDGAAEGRPLADHVAAYEAALEGKGNTAKHTKETARMLLNVFKGCTAKMAGDITTAKLRAHLAKRRADTVILNAEGKPANDADGKAIMRRGISARRHNAIITALGGFFRWCIRERRAFENPTVHLPKLNERTDKRHPRRALEPAEVRALLTTAAAGGDRYSMAGVDRAILYRVAVETGLRMNELRTLTRASVDAGTVTVKAGYSKHRREDVLPMRAELAEALRKHVEHKAPAALVFTLPGYQDVLRAFKLDLAAAGIPYADAEGRVVDFHALRHTFISSLASSGVHPKTAQTLARHSTISLTMDRYTHTLRGAEAAALDCLPDYSPTHTEAAGALRTGTDGVPVDAGNPTPQNAGKISGAGGKSQGEIAGAKMWGKSGGAQGPNQYPSHTIVDKRTSVNVSAGNPMAMRESVDSVAENLQAGVGFEPTINGFAIRSTETTTPINDNDLRSDTGMVRGKSGGAQDSKTIPDDAGLRAVSNAWPTLPTALKAGIVAMVRAAGGGEGGR